MSTICLKHDFLLKTIMHAVYIALSLSMPPYNDFICVNWLGIVSYMMTA